MTVNQSSRTAGFTWLLQIAIAASFFKLAFAPQSQAIFTSFGGQTGATASALAELMVAALLLIPAGFLTRIDPSCSCSAREIRGWGDVGGWIGYANVVGAVLALGVIGGAIATHLLAVGISIPLGPGSATTDGGSFFALEMIIAVMAGAVFFLRRREANAFVHALVHVAKTPSKAVPAVQ
ncbi:MAG: hypothetical protein AAF911_03060 [Planctomycetota bacterium]